MRAHEAQEAKKKAEQEAAARTKAELQANLDRQMAQKQADDRRAKEEENQRNLAAAKERQQQKQARLKQFAGKIVRTKAKIEEQEVAPMGATIKYAVSPHALHVAAATLKGSRAQVLMDRVPGPALDELLWINGRKFEPVQQMAGNRISDEMMNVNDAPVVFSEDGKRFAYVGRQGNQFVLMVDGKEAARGVDIPKHHWTDQGAVDSLSFIPGSNHFRYILTIPKPKELEGRAESYRGTQLVVEGDKNPPLENLHGLPICFSGDGQHYAYFFPPEGGSDELVVDGKVNPAKYTARGYRTISYQEGHLAPLFTGDSKHLITLRNKPLPDPNRKGEFAKGPQTVFVDERPVLEAPSIDRL